MQTCPPLQLKPRMVMTPLAISPPSSTPEPDMSSIPQDAATIPHSATPQVLTGRTPNTNDVIRSHNWGHTAIPAPFNLFYFISASLHLHQQAGQHGPQPGQEEDPATSGSLWTWQALCGAAAGCAGLHWQRLPAENRLHPPHTRLRGRKNIRYLAEIPSCIICPFIHFFPFIYIDKVMSQLLFTPYSYLNLTKFVITRS